jgi:DNA-binding NtrC family response regulator
VSARVEKEGGPVELFANRFAIVDERRAIDLATGRHVLLMAASAGDPSEARRWAVRCDVLHKLQHRCLARLVDYGSIGRSERFEAWSCGPAWTGAREPALQIRMRAESFLHACGFANGSEGAGSVRQCASGLAFLPAASIRRSEPLPDHIEHAAPVNGVERADLRLEDCGLERIPRAAVASIAELFEPAPSPRARAVGLIGEREAGLSTCILELARAARLQGLVPVASELVDSPFASLFESRTLFVIDRSGVAGWRSLIDAVVRSARSHVVLLASDKEITGVDCVSLEPLEAATLVNAVRPTELPTVVEARVFRAAERANGLPGRFVAALWGETTGSRRGSSLSTRIGIRVAEVPAIYGGEVDRPAVSGSVATRWPAPGELVALRRRAQAGMELVNRGRHALGERTLRQAAASLARRSDWPHASQAAIALGRAVAARGRSKDAQALFSEAREYATRAGSDSALIDVAVGSGHVWIDLARLDEAEATLGVAVAAARASGEIARIAESVAAMARCLFWRGKFADAELVVGGVEQSALPEALTIRLSIAASRTAVGTRNVALAVSLSAAAVQRAMRLGDPVLLARTACAAAFAHLAVNDIDAVERDVILSVGAARAARDPLQAFRARLLLGEAWRRSGRASAATALLNRLNKFGGLAVPALLKARRALFAALVQSEARPEEVVSRHVASLGLPALALFAPSARTEAWSGADTFVENTVSILHACQNAADEVQVLVEVCRRIRRQLEAASVAILAVGPPQWWTVASDGGRVDISIAERAAAAGAAIAPHRAGDRIEAAVPVRYGGETIGAIIARWTLGTNHSLGRATPMLTMAAAAAAPAIGSARAARMRQATPSPADFVGAGPSSEELRQAIERAAAAPFSVLIEGESGSGKELVARAVHRNGPRRDRLICTLNCAALPDDLVEAELFGHARGAFTGAVGERAGVFEEAHGGTLFLDEIGELSARAQAKVLRVIQDGELRRVGENISRRVDVRIVAATNRDLREEVTAGRFRRDLLYRLDVIRIVVPPLRERREDIPGLVEHFWREAKGRIGSHATLSAATVAALARYDWPGNVRELQNVLAALAVRSPRRGVVAVTALSPPFGESMPPEGWRLEDARRTFEERFVRAALVRAGGRRGQTAAELGVTRQGLTKLMARLGISD